jgi:hypothetical protein
MAVVARSTLHHLILGLRVLLLRRIDPAVITSIGPEPVILALLSLGVATSFEVFAAERIMFSAWGVTAHIASVAVLVAGLLAIGTKRRGLDVGAVLSTLLGASFWFELTVRGVALLHGTFVDEAALPEAVDMMAGTAGLAALCWFMIAVAVFAVRVTLLRPRRFAIGLVASYVAAIAVLPTMPVVRGAGTQSEGLLQAAFNAVPRKRVPRGDEANEKPVNVEAVFARQPQLIDAQLDPLPLSRSDRRELYFVGMATYAEQDVFKREITAARDIFDQRFETDRRSILLINHADTLETLPLAGTANLERVLWRLAQVMDVDKDVLVLFITTHGSEGQLAVSFTGFTLNGLTPASLAAILDRTGIKNRVIILSACHAGSFIPALANPDTLVLAAARADRSSFGCSNERDWTYFGDALFNHALRETHSFVDAFDSAVTLIKRWETDQKLEPPSEPQISLGAAIVPKLADIAHRYR